MTPPLVFFTYDSWDTFLKKELNLNAERHKPILLSISCIHSLMLKSKVENLEFSVTTPEEDITPGCLEFSFQFLPNQDNIKTLTGTNSNLSVDIKNILNHLSDFNIEKTLGILGYILSESIPKDKLITGCISFPGFSVRWEKKNLTE